MAVLNGGVIEYNELIKKPNSLSKDYYIYRLAKERGLSKAQAIYLQTQITKRSGGGAKALNKIAPPPKSLDKGPCHGFGLSNILNASLSCQNTLTTVSFSLKLSPATRTLLAQNLSKSYPKKAQILLALNTPNILNSLANINAGDEFIAYYKLMSQGQKNLYFNKEFSAKFMDTLYNSKGFTSLINSIVLNRNYTIFRQNLLKINPQITEKKEAFVLGVNAITLGNEAIAKQFFTRAAQSFEKQEQKDNALFWVYLISKDKQILSTLAQSTSVNLYSLYAKDLIPSEPFSIYVPRPKNMHYQGQENIYDPFCYEKMKKLVKNLNAEQAMEYAKQFYSNESIAYYVYFMQKAYGYKRHYFVMPHSPYLQNISIHRKAMIYAIARQESLFIPGIISTSYALGTMQFMPFLANAIGKKELKIPNFDQDLLFDTDTAYRFANHHLNYLDKFLFHPLFTAYAYNGGIGFTKKLITKNNMFRQGKFEPFLSMELVPVQETRLYGKKVLSNYIVYRALMGSSIKISEFLQTLSQPHLSDKFRN